MRDPDYQDRFFELLRRAEENGYRPESGVDLEAAFRLADAAADPEYGLLARYFYVFAVAPIEPANAVVAFSWCVSHEEHASGLIPQTSLVQLYGIVAGILRSYPEYSLEQIERTFDEMEEKFRKLGMSMRDVWHHRVYGALGVGNRDAAREYFERWTAEPGAGRSCPVCDLGTRVLYYLYLEDYDRAFAHARPIWDGRRCDDGQPLMTAAGCLVPLLRLGQFERARQCFQMAAAELGTLGYAGIWAAGRELAYLSAVGSVDEAQASFERHFAKSWSAGTPADTFGYLLSAKLFSKRLVEEGVTSVSLRVPSACPIHRGDDTYEPAALLEFFGDETRTLGARFDRRNGNSEFLRIAELTESIYDGVRAR